MSDKKLKEIKRKLKPFWKRYLELQSNYHKRIKSLEKIMNNKLKLKTKLEFFYVDGECVGIGAEDYADRKYFPLIQDL